jgi:hypothetical protein
MGSVPPLLSFLLMIAAGWIHRHQLIVIQFLQLRIGCSKTSSEDGASVSPTLSALF